MPTASDRQQIRAVLRGVDRVTERAVVDVTLRVNRNLLRESPVDTGWSRANWVPRVGAPHEGTVGERPATGGAFQDPGTARAGQASVLGYTRNQGRTYITNNVPYIVDLNERGSTRALNSYGVTATPGFVQRAIADAVEAVSR